MKCFLKKKSNVSNKKQPNGIINRWNTCYLILITVALWFQFIWVSLKLTSPKDGKIFNLDQMSKQFDAVREIRRRIENIEKSSPGMVRESINGAICHKIVKMSSDSLIAHLIDIRTEMCSWSYSYLLLLWLIRLNNTILKVMCSSWMSYVAWLVQPRSLEMIKPEKNY